MTDKKSAPIFPINEHTATVKLVDGKGWKAVTHKPKVANSMLDIFVIEDKAKGYRVFRFDWETDKWKVENCETFDEIIQRFSYDMERN